MPQGELPVLFQFSKTIKRQKILSFVKVMRELFWSLLFLGNIVAGDDRVFAESNYNETWAQKYERCLTRVHADRTNSEHKKPEPVDLNDIVNIRQRNVSGPHFASGTNFKLKPLLLWAGATVPTDFDGEFTKDEIYQLSCAVAFFHGFTCITFVKRKPYHANYLLITKSKSGCFSETVGKIEGVGYQVVNLDQNNDYCWNHGTIVHELMHAVGRFHEHTRMDNKHYIHIHYNNIPQNDHFQYQTPKEIGYEYEDMGYYDYASIMHYPSEIGGKRVISAIFKGDYDQQDRNQDALGQRKRPSKQDEVKLNLLYNCNGQSTSKLTTTTTTTVTTPITTMAVVKSPMWTPTKDSVCPNGALPGSKMKVEIFTDGKQISLTIGWDTLQRAHSKSVCDIKCRVDKDCVRSIWMPQNSVYNCATTNWKTIKEQCVTFNQNALPNIETFGYWTPYCTETHPCIVKSLMCKCPSGSVKSEVAIMDVAALCGEKWKESATFSLLCAGFAGQ